jgi:hypothetical protein
VVVSANGRGAGERRRLPALVAEADQGKVRIGLKCL